MIPDGVAKFLRCGPFARAGGAFSAIKVGPVVENARVVSQTEGLRSALLTSISHDFGTPLASIIGSASSLISYGKTYSFDVVQELLVTILEEAERLNRFVKNVLQMTRLESGALVPRLQWADVGDLIATAGVHKLEEGQKVKPVTAAPMAR